MNPFNPDRAVEVEEHEEADSDADPVVPYLLAKINNLQDKLKKTKAEQSGMITKATTEIGLKVDTLANELRQVLGEAHGSMASRIDKLDGSSAKAQKALEARLEAISDAHFRVENWVRDLRQKPLELDGKGVSGQNGKPATVPAQPQPDAGAAMLAQMMEQMKALQPQPRRKVARFEVVRDDHARAKQLIPIYEED